MAANDPVSILTFVPAKDFAASTQFYKDLGFKSDDAEDVRYMSHDSCGFLLQDYYVEEWANNFMMAMHVEDVSEWHKRILKSGAIDKHEDAEVSEPVLEEWGMIVMHLTDPSGVLWHITQTPPK